VEGLFVSHKDFGLHADDPGGGCKFLQQIAEQVAAATAFENLVHRLERHVLLQLLLVSGIDDRVSSAERTMSSKWDNIGQSGSNVTVAWIQAEHCNPMFQHARHVVNQL
jgi:hypothetical protein